METGLNKPSDGEGLPWDEGGGGDAGADIDG